MAIEDTSHKWVLVNREGTKHADDNLPAPSMRFRRKSWLEFQRALDPLAPPRRLPGRVLRGRAEPRERRLPPEELDRLEEPR